MNSNSPAEITTRNQIARGIIAGFVSTAPTLAGVFGFIDSALCDVPALQAELRQASAELEAARLDRANLLAAMCATMGAHADGEADPLYYLRDELQDRQGRPQGHREAP